MSKACTVSSVWSGPLGRNCVRPSVQPRRSGTLDAAPRAGVPPAAVQSASNWAAADAATGPSRSNDRSRHGGVPVGAAEIFRGQIAAAGPQPRAVGNRPFTVIAQISRTLGLARQATD